MNAASFPKVRVSLGSAALLGLRRLRIGVLPTTAYLIVGGRCTWDCAFCPQGRSGVEGEDRLSRVRWPEYPPAQVAEAIRASGKRVERVCLQVLASPAWLQEVLHFLRLLRERAPGGAETVLVPAYLGPVSVSCQPASLEEVAALFQWGVDRVGIPLDVACPDLFRLWKGGNWERRRQLIAEAGRAWPGCISTHLIAGLGETERDLVEAMVFFIQNRVTVGLFAFTPVPGTRLAHQPPPERSSYRRLQIARYLLTEGLARWEDMDFDEAGRLVRIEVAPAAWARVGGGAPGEPFGEPFRTSGCPGCNRPYYNERPGQVPYNYPRPLTPAEAAAAWAEAGVEIIVRSRPGAR